MQLSFLSIYFMLPIFNFGCIYNLIRPKTKSHYLPSCKVRPREHLTHLSRPPCWTLQALILVLFLIWSCGSRTSIETKQTRRKINFNQLCCKMATFYLVGLVALVLLSKAACSGWGWQAILKFAELKVCYLQWNSNDQQIFSKKAGMKELQD